MTEAEAAAPGKLLFWIFSNVEEHDLGIMPGTISSTEYEMYLYFRYGYII